MIMQVFSVHDKAVGAYLPPWYARSKGEAIRSFTDACNNKEQNFAKYSLDYTLVWLGEWDDSSGHFIARDPERVLGANEVVVDPVSVPPASDRR